MFGLLNSSQIYRSHNESITDDNLKTSSPISATANNKNKVFKNNRQRSKLVRKDSGNGTRRLSDVTLPHSLHGMKVPVYFIEKLIKSELLTGYEALKHFKNFHHPPRQQYLQPNHHPGNNLRNIDCGNLHGNNYCSGINNDTKGPREMTIIKYPNDTQYRNQHQTQMEEMEVIDSTTDNSSSILRYNIDNCLLQREDSVIGNTNEMISDQSMKSNDLSLSSCSDSPAAERKTSNSPTPTNNPKGIQRRKLMQMVTFLDQQNQRLQKELAKEKRRRSEELSRIIKSLICTESKLKLDKKQINQRLLEKDTEICRLVSLNRTLRKQVNGKQNNETTPKTTEECLMPEALQCNNCKKKFYAIDTKENWTQTTKDGRKSNDDPTTEIGSSSDDTVSSSFYGARRSVRYTSKRTFGTFRDYMRSRSMNIDDPNLDNSEENASTISRDESQNSYEKMNIYSRTIDRLHGVRRVSSIEGDLDSEYDNITSRKIQSLSPGVEEDDLFFPAQDEQLFTTKIEKIELSPCSSKSNSLSRSKDFSEASPSKHEFETSTDDWYASASDAEEESESVRTKSYGYNVAVNPVLECVNQILLQQSMEESTNDSQPTSLEGNDTPTMGSSQHSDHQSPNSSNSSCSKDQANTGTISRKRVHFSTKNSMVHVPRNDDEHENNIHHLPLELSSPSASVIAEQIKDNILNYESIYSNEYEPIGSENNSCNLYVDMEAKLSPEARTSIENKPPKLPPALPPKPANLIKFKKAHKLGVPPMNFSGFEETIDDDSNLNASEPDYCSISEVNVAINSVKVVADVHKEPHFEPALEVEAIKNDNHSLKTDEIEEIFADIPKLPNVAAIIAPKTPPSKLSYTLKAHEMEVIPRSPRQFKRKHVPNILAEINKRMINLNPPTSSKSSNNFTNGIHSMSSSPMKVQSPLAKLPPQTSNPVMEDKHLPLQAEFDWYNLDVEYGKSPSNQPDIIKASDINSIVENEENELIGLHGVEYNLDEEFSLATSNQPDIIKENFNEPSNKTVNDAVLTQTVCEDFPIITEVTPCLKKIKTASFDKFIDSSGLSTKPLPRQRKIYFSGPFV